MPRLHPASHYQDNNLHREDGPACIYLTDDPLIPNGDDWWLNGKSVTKEEHARRTIPIAPS